MRSESSPDYEGIKTIDQSPITQTIKSESSPDYEGIKTSTESPELQAQFV